MRVAYVEPADLDPNCEIRLGASSWDDDVVSVKYAWRVEGGKGKVARGGEVPVEALPQMLDFAIRKGYLRLCPKGEEGKP